MSFLDSLENNLKNLENGADREDAGRERERQKSDRAEQAQVAPWAEKLKTSSYTEELLKAATRESFLLRVKVYITWLGSLLRLDARERRMELRPGREGVEVVFLVNNEQKGSRSVDLEGDPVALVREWLAS